MLGEHCNVTQPLPHANVIFLSTIHFTKRLDETASVNRNNFCNRCCYGVSTIYGNAN